jgi:hypothetical protein
MRGLAEAFGAAHSSASCAHVAGLDTFSMFASASAFSASLSAPILRAATPTPRHADGNRPFEFKTHCANLSFACAY